MYTEKLEAMTPHKSNETNEARPGRLAFFLLGLLETNQISAYRQEVLSFADQLRSPTTTNEALRASYRLGMEEALGMVERLITSPGGTLLIRMPVGFKGNAGFQDIVREFATEAPEEAVPYRVLGIPTCKVTAAKALPYPRKPGKDDYDPMVSLRIIGENDPQASVYSSPGVVSKLPSEGTWHTFHLNTCEILFYPEI